MLAEMPDQKMYQVQLLNSKRRQKCQKLGSLALKMLTRRQWTKAGHKIENEVKWTIHQHDTDL